MQNANWLEKGLKITEKCLEMHQKMFGEEHPETFEVNNMGALLSNMGNNKEAEKYYKRALEAQERVLGAEHSDTLVSVSNMGVLLSDMGQNEEAEKYYKKALSPRTLKFGQNTLIHF